MPQMSTHFRVFLSCPSDLKSEREAIHEVIRALNRDVGKGLNVHLEPVDFQNDALPGFGLGMSPQRQIDQEIGPYDIYLGLMKHRFGAPTEGVGSGTVHEFNLALKRMQEAGPESPQHIFFYFSNQPLPMDSSALTEALKVLEFRKQLEPQGLYTAFQDEDDLLDKVRSHLSRLMQRLAAQTIPPAPPTPTPATSATSQAGGQADASPPSAQTIVESSPILDHIRPDDRVLALNFQANMLKLEPPPGAKSWEELPCGVANLRLLNQSGRGEALRETNLRVDAWEKSIGEVREQVKQALEGLQGRLHVFFGGPHALALWLGRCLEVQGRQVPTFIHQWDGREKCWKFFSLPPELAPDVQKETFYASLTLEVESTGPSGVVLNINATSKASPAQLKALCERVGAREVHTLSPQNNGWMTTFIHHHAAIEQLRRAVDKLHSLYPAETIHLCTSAPIALLVAFGRQLRHTVTSHLVVHHYDTSTGRYYPVMDVMTGVVAKSSRPRLEIISEDGGIQYILNGEVQLGYRSDLKGRDGIDRRTEDEQVLHKAVTKLSSHLLPERIEQAIQGLSELDIEVKVEGKATELSWELLFLSRTQHQFAALIKGWTLTRFVKGKPRQFQPKRASELKVLIIPALNDASYEGPYLKLAELEEQLEKAGAQVKLLTYGVELARIGKAIEEFQPHIIHWVGHGGSYKSDSFAGQFQVQSEGEAYTIDYTRMRMLLQPAKELRLVTFCACNVGQPGEGFGVPTHVLLEGAGAVIGFRDEIGVVDGRNFSGEFYAQVLAGASVRDAVARARAIMHARHPVLPGSFAAPMLTVSEAAGTDPIVKVEPTASKSTQPQS